MQGMLAARWRLLDSGAGDGATNMATESKYTSPPETAAALLATVRRAAA